MSASALIFGVYGFAADRSFVREPIALFFDPSDAADFAMHPERDGFEQRNCYIGAGREDHRTSGYRPAPLHTFDYAAWCREIDAKRAEAVPYTRMSIRTLPNGRAQVAA